MSHPLPPRQDSAKEAPLFAGRLALLGAVCLCGLLILIARLAYLCIIEGDEYYQKSQNNHLRPQTIPAPRGIIYDRFGRALATNRNTYAVFLESSLHSAETLDESVARFEELTGLKAAQTHRSPRPANRPCLAKRLEPEIAVPLLERQKLSDEMPGVSIERSFSRAYSTQANPDRRVMSHVIGFIGEVDEAELNALKEAGVPSPQFDYYGKKGIERYYEDDLRGVKGLQIQQYDAKGRRIGEPHVQTPSVPGAALWLTLDSDLQTAGSRLMEGYRGALIALDPRNGEILALVSKPEFSYPKQPGDSEFNLAVNGQYSPGSTFKIVPASAALAAGHDPSEKLLCEKRFPYGDVQFKCLGWHGEIDMYGALGASCNVYFFRLARKLKWGPIATAALQFGFGAKTQIDFYKEDRYGLIDAPGTAYLAGREDGDILQMAIGQGAKVLVTPLQIASAYAAIANPGGLLPRPHFLRYVDHHDERPLLMSSPGHRGQTPASDPAVREALIRGLRLVVESSSGTGRHAQFNPEWKVAGKTGSAEIGGGRETHAWFAGFAPYDNPEICVTVLCEESGHGGEMAAPIAKEFLQIYFDVTRKNEAQMRASGIEPIQTAAPPMFALSGAGAPTPESAVEEAAVSR